MASIHKKLSRVRKPRVHITYDVETDGAAVSRELPFVVGVMGDFSGNPSTPVKSLKDRKFVQIDRDNFDDVMSKISPELNMKVENTIQGDGSEMAVQLKFNSMDDFDPAKIVEQVEPLRKLMETRQKLNDLMSKVDRSEDLEEILERVLKNEGDMKALQATLGMGGGGDAPAASEPPPAPPPAPADTPDGGDAPAEPQGSDEPETGGDQ